jgi:SWI/SNF-related matrix-associated actin-dependent regulator of chromatin subfamily A-like protein 1
MIITYWKGVFVVDKASTPQERSTLKKAGFELHEPSVCPMDKHCKACRAGVGSRYWTSRVTSATRLKSVCNKLALDAMKGHLEKLAKSRATTSDINVPAPPGLSFMPYQKAGIAYHLAHKDSYNGDDMGLGKTIQSLGVVNSLRVSNPRLNTIVLCPRTLTFNWKNEAEKWLLDIPGVGKPEIVIPTSGNFEVPRRDNLFVITTYEKCTGDTLLTDSLKRVWDVLIPDEAHALKNWEAQRTKAVLDQEGLMQRAHRTVFLSGTPIENYPKEIWTIAAAICPAKFGSWTEYAKRYCGIHREGGRLVDTGATNLAELQQRLRTSFMIRRLKSDVLKELPPKRRQLIVLGDSKVDWSQDPDFKRWHDLYERDYEAKLAALEAAKNEEEYARAARALDSFTGVAFEDMSDMRHRTAVAKLPACIEYIDKVLETNIEKLVIFAHHQDVLAELALHYGAQAVSLHGQTTQRAREAAVKRFREGDARIFIGGLKAAGVGLNLYEASTVIFIEIDWNPAKLTQAEDRLCRFGQKKMVHVIHLVLAGTLDVNMVQRVMAKQAVVDKALNQKPEQGIKLSPQTVMAFRC